MDADANAEQVRYWNETAGPKWVQNQRLIDAQIRPLGRRTMERAGIAPGARVLDVGCGCGDTTLDIGARAGAAGRAVGVDVSAPMLARAEEAAREAGATNVRFERADAAIHRFPAGAFDVVFSRFGVMFFADPVAAFANLRAALRPGGRLAFICWQALAENPWALVGLQAAAQHVTLPPPPAPDAPGPFAFASAERVRDILSRAGFTSISIEPVREMLTVGGAATVDEAARFLVEGVGPATAALRDAEPAVRAAVLATVRAALAPHATPDGVRMGAAAWIVTATAPAA
jgi:ubiquinone/menaquinone biosynthesis C-methylase UbiE